MRKTSRCVPKNDIDAVGARWKSNELEARINKEKHEVIVINHGANDRETNADMYIEGYTELLEVIRKLNPDAKIVALSAFCGAYPKELEYVVNKFILGHSSINVTLDIYTHLSREKKKINVEKMNAYITHYSLEK